MEWYMWIITYVLNQQNERTLKFTKRKRGEIERGGGDIIKNDIFILKTVM